MINNVLEHHVLSLGPFTANNSTQQKMLYLYAFVGVQQAEMPKHMFSCIIAKQ